MCASLEASLLSHSGPLRSAGRQESAKRVSLSGARARVSTRGCQEGVKIVSRGPGVKRASRGRQEGVKSV